MKKEENEGGLSSLIKNRTGKERGEERKIGKGARKRMGWCTSEEIPVGLGDGHMFLGSARPQKKYSDLRRRVRIAGLVGSKAVLCKNEINLATNSRIQR